jgi:hypothetical protein
VTDIFKYNLPYIIYRIYDRRLYKFFASNTFFENRGDIMHGYMHGCTCGCGCGCMSWDSLTKKEKLEILTEKKKWLEAKTKYVADAIKELEKGK